MAQKPLSAQIHPGVGFRIKSDMPRPGRKLVDSFREFDSPDISDQLNRLYALVPEIYCLTGSKHKLVGPVCTVKVYPGDNLMVHKALDVANPGDIIAVDARASRTNAVIGGLISMKAKSRKIAGFIVDGFIRDLPEILPLDFPVFARGATPIGPLHRGPGEINFPICCGGVVVHPGDIVVADQAGVVIVPLDYAPEILARLIANRARNQKYLADVTRGDFSNEWVDELLESSGCVVGGDPVRQTNKMPARQSKKKTAAKASGKPPRRKSR